jgi:hypothetical protein
MRIRDPGWEKFGSGMEKNRIRDPQLCLFRIGTDQKVTDQKMPLFSYRICFEFFRPFANDAAAAAANNGAIPPDLSFITLAR